MFESKAKKIQDIAMRNNFINLIRMYCNSIVLFHKDFFPGGEQPEQRILAQKL